MEKQGRLVIPSKVNKSIHVIKQKILCKSVPKVSYKRLIMLQRRIDSLLTERSSWEEQNKDLSNTLKAEKMLTASLRKESFDLQRLYHDSLITINTYKVKQAEIAQAMSACLREINSTYPQMVAFSESLTNNKIRITNMLNSLPSSEYEFSSRQFQDTKKIIDGSIKKSGEKPRKHRVGPMVKGHLITKPKIMLERIMVPQPLDQDHVNTNLSALEVDNELTPIPEENEHEEDMRLRHVSMRPKCKLGRSWKLQRAEKGRQERERSRGNDLSSAVAYDGDSSDSENNLTALDVIEPVVRLQDVSRLLQNSSLLKVDAARTGDNDCNGSSINHQSEAETRHIPVSTTERRAEDPLEGSSWMFNNNHNRCNNLKATLNSERRSSVYKSDSSSDDENDVLIQNNASNLSSSTSIIDTLVIKNQPENHSRESITSSPSSKTSCDTLSCSPAAEPDSTNNIDVQLLNNFSFKRSSENVCRSSSSSSASINRSLIYSNNTSNEHNTIDDIQSGERILINTNLLTVRLSKVPDTTKLSFSKDRCSIGRRHSSFCNNCSPVQNQPEVSGKRVRKPKTHLYPGEEDPPTKKKNCKSAKVSTGKKLLEHTKSKGRISTKKRQSRETTPNSILDDNNSGSSSKTENTKKKSAVGVNKEPIYKQRSMKKSIHTPRTSSAIGIHHLLDSENLDNRPRRNKTQICYKESPLNVKQRRP